MNPTKKLWRGLAAVFVLSFAVLGWLGREIYLAAPPIPKAVMTADGQTIYTGDDIQYGQRVWLSAGGQQLGTVWGHGSYVAPDWSADWLHREATILASELARRTYGSSSGALAADQKAAIDARVQTELRANTYEAQKGTITVSPERAQAMALVAQHYDALFGNDAELATLR